MTTPQGPAATLSALVRDRKLGELNDASCRSALTAAGFVDTAEATGAVDQILAALGDDVDPVELLIGCAAAADPDRALFNAGRLLASPERPACPVAPADLARFLGASQHMSDLLVARPSLLAFLGRSFDPLTAPARYREAGAGEEAARALRLLQQEDLLGIAWADLIGDLDVEHTTWLISRLADAVIAGAAHGLGSARQFAVIALGKLGGSELNYSSDIDLLFVRPESATDQVSADAVARRLIELLGKQLPEGHLYRVDMRLRPEGSSGALTRRLASCLEYYGSLGRPWERQMLTKARLIVESEDGAAGQGFLDGTRAWILERGLDAGAIRQFKRLKEKTEAQHASPEARTDIKQAPGGIRDIETIVQFLGLQHAHNNPSLLASSTLHGLERLRVAGAIGSLEAARLRKAYRFFRRVENLLQVMHRVQTHRLPADRTVLAHLAGARDSKSFDMQLTEHRRRVRALLELHFTAAFELTEGPSAALIEHVLTDAPEGPRESTGTRQLSEAAADSTTDIDSEAEAERSLAEVGFTDPRRALGVLRRLAAPVSRFLPPSPRLVSALASVAPRLIERLSLGPDPDAALSRFERMTRGVGAREILYTQLALEPTLLDMLVDLASGSPYLSDLLVQEPEIFDPFIDALLTGVRGRRSRRQLLADAAHGGHVGDPWILLRDHKELEMLRIGVHDLRDAASTRETLADLSQVCIDVLRAAYDLVHQQAIRKHGPPESIRGMSARHRASMAVLALGKVGSLEANYASDADLIFVYSGDGDTDGDDTPNKVFFAQVAEEFMARLGGQRGGPRLYKIDTRLRPEGTKGPLVNSFKGWKAYYKDRAALFEYQALLKARVVAGDAELGQQVLADIRRLVRHFDIPEDLAARMRELREKIGEQAVGLDLKRSPGGLVDVEYLTQYLQLLHGRQNPSVLVPETPRALELLGDAELLPRHVADRLRDIYLWLRRVEMRLQIAMGLDRKEVPTDGKPLRDLALRLGYADTAEGDAGHLFLTDLDDARAEVRTRYDEWLSP